MSDDLEEHRTYYFSFRWNHKGNIKPEPLPTVAQGRDGDCVAPDVDVSEIKRTALDVRRRQAKSKYELCAAAYGLMGLNRREAFVISTAYLAIIPDGVAFVAMDRDGKENALLSVDLQTRAGEIDVGVIGEAVNLHINEKLVVRPFAELAEREQDARKQWKQGRADADDRPGLRERTKRNRQLTALVRVL